MPVDATAREGDWTRLLVPVAVLVASVAACSVMPPAGASARAAVCQPEAAKRAHWSVESANATAPSMEMELSSQNTTSLLSLRWPASVMASCETPSMRQPSPAIT